MIPVPSNRLLWLVAALLPLAAGAGAVAELWPLCLLGLCAVGIAAAVDLWFTRAAAFAPMVSVEPISRLTKHRPGGITVTFRYTETTPPQVRFALALPVGFESSERATMVGLPAGGKSVVLNWECVARKRGRFAVGPACIEMRSRFGFWLLRRQQPLPGEIRVYPNLFTERKQLAALFLNRGAAEAQLRRMVGRGREFERLREYQPGDSFDEVHWKGTAKRGRPITKIFQVERTQEIYVIIDASRLSARPVTEAGGKTTTTLERHITAALVLLLAAGRQGDRFGLVAHADKVRAFLRAGSGTTHYAACREAIHALEPQESSPDFADLFSLLRTRLRRRSLLVFLTDLSDPVLAEDFTSHIRVLSRQHLVLVNQMRAPGVEPLFARPVKNDAEIVDRLAGHLQWKEMRDVAGRLQPFGVRASMLANETLAAEMVSQYLQVKRRQLL